MLRKIRHKTYHPDGFTLVEVLLGLLIFAIISLSLYNTFWMGLKIDRKASGINKSYQEARASFEVLSRDLENAFVYDFSQSYSKQSSLSGTDKEIVFLIPNNQGIAVVRYALALPDLPVTKLILNKYKGASVPVEFLMRQQALLPEHLASGKYGGEEILATGIKKGGLKFEYGYIPQQNAQERTVLPELQWRKSWNSKTLPLAVRVTLTLFDSQNPKSGAVLRRDIYLPQMRMME